MVSKKLFKKIKISTFGSTVLLNSFNNPIFGGSTKIKNLDKIDKTRCGGRCNSNKNKIAKDKIKDKQTNIELSTIQIDKPIEQNKETIEQIEKPVEEDKNFKNEIPVEKEKHL